MRIQFTARLTTRPDRSKSGAARIATGRLLLLSWEIYLILGISALLRFLTIDKTIFDDDEAVVFQMAHDAVAHGLWPLTSNRASLGILNPPFVVYLLMIPSSLSANPLWGEVWVALFNTAAVLLTYGFTRRYYGRLAGTITALLYATSAGAWIYSRNIWPQNFLPFFTLLLLICLFRGVVERKKGWFCPAVVLIGILYQLHGSSLIVTIPLLFTTILLAFKTSRLRAVLLSIFALLLLFAPCIFWEFHSHFADLKLLLSPTRQQASTDLQALHFYLFFLHPTLINPYLNSEAQHFDNHIIVANAHSVLLTTPLHHFKILLPGEFFLAVLLFLGGIVTTAMLILLPQKSKEKGTNNASNALLCWWTELQATPRRQGLLLLFLWQTIPLVLLTHHSMQLFAHYFILLLPGQFILISLCITKTITLCQKRQPDWSQLIRYGGAALAIPLILAQLIGTSSALIDHATGHFSDQQVYPGFNDLNSLQNALHDADQLAQRNHIHRIYAMEDLSDKSALDYLSEQIKTPIELNGTWKCFILPDIHAGPVVFLAAPDSALADILLSHYTNATLIEEPQRLGGSPFELYILTARPVPAPISHTFARSLQLLSSKVQLLQSATTNQQWLASRWRITETRAPAPRTNYGFDFQVQSKAPGQSSDLTCTPTATWADDQLFALQESVKGSAVPAQIMLQAATFTQQPTLIHIGPLTMTTFNEDITPLQPLLTTDRQKSVRLPVALATPRQPRAHTTISPRRAYHQNREPERGGG